MSDGMLEMVRQTFDYEPGNVLEFRENHRILIRGRYVDVDNGERAYRIKELEMGRTSTVPEMSLEEGVVVEEEYNG